jgi:transcription initiation factor TFIID subunit 7
MGDRQPIRDRTLILRVLVPGLETRLRDKMKEVEDSQADPGPSPANSSSAASAKEMLLDLEGVTCEPTQEGSTLFSFHCDGATYPARLVNLPCPVEVHKTHDHAMYYKCVDIAQMLIVYEDSMALDEADAVPKTEGYPSYYHSGLTPPMKRVVERRFALREHAAVPPPRAEVCDVEAELHHLMLKISKEPGKRNKVPSLASAQHANKILEEVVEEVVDYEPWMDEYGAQPSGIEFDAGDQIASLHPEIWLSPEQIERLKATYREKEEEELRKKEAAQEKKEKKKKKKKEKAAAALAAEASKPSKKIGIASKKHAEPVDDLTQAALETMTAGDLMDAALDEDDNFDFGFDLDNMDDIPM